MTASVRLLFGPGGSGKTAKLRERAEALAGNVWWIVPTARHAGELTGLPEHVRVLRFFQAAGRCARLPENARLLDDTQRKIVFRHVVDEVARARRWKSLAPLADTHGLSDSLLGLIDELHLLGVTPEQFLEFAGQTAAGPLRDRVDAEVALVDLAYREMFERHGFVDSAGLFAAACAGRPPKLAAVFVDGFARLTPNEQRLLQRLTGFASEVWITLPSNGPESLSHPGEMTTSLSEAFPESEVIQLESGPGTRPPALSHLVSSLFEESAPASEASEGVTLIEAPGVVGECRMVARAIRKLIDAGTSPESILVSARSLGEYETLLAEMFEEYGIPNSMERHVPFERVPGIVALVQAARLPDDGWSFEGVTAILRSGWFRPTWAGDAADDLPLWSDWLLRDLGVPRDRDAFLRAVRLWSESPPTPLEDEAAETGTRRVRHEKAKLCRPLLDAFFAAWDAAPANALLADHIRWMQAWAAELGFPAEESDFVAWWAALEQFQTLDDALNPGRRWTRADFLRQIDLVARFGHVTRGDADAAGVRVVPADAAAGLHATHLFLLGLDEGAFPSLTAGARMYSDAERQEFVAVGLQLEVAMERLPREMTLFHRLVAAASGQVVFSRPAVDEKGQEQLPATFWREVARLVSRANVERKTMLIDGYDSDAPLSEAERRVRFAVKKNQGKCELSGHLDHVRRVMHARFGEKQYTPFEGMLADPAVKADVAEAFGPKKSFSATSLEDYVACPFKYFGKHVLRLAPLPDPADEIEAHSRGSAFHRALAALGPKNAPAPDLARRLGRALSAAVQEELDRSASPIMRRLWELERERWERWVNRYPEQWSKYEEHFADTGRPRFHRAELPYRIALNHNDVDLSLRGVIDRVDTVEGPAGAGAVVVDYKTGSAGNYSAARVNDMQKLQLGVYALAVEKLLPEFPPRRLLYWLPLDTGPHGFVPKQAAGWAGAEGWDAFRNRLLDWLTEIAERIRRAEFPLHPRDDKSCEYCDYRRACRISGSRNRIKDWDFELPPAVEEAADE
ncbi:MAG: PD-(D/E)XK nuclease family protein [Gemmataceae bacterium]|nr:PD-(D/E)XK nuclease family protein [Gemmataceae bacterium]